jgi:hypothetical protein
MPVNTVAIDYSTVTSTSQKLTAMVAGYQYIIRPTGNCYYKVGPNSTVTAVAADDGSTFLAAGCVAFVSKQGANDTVAVIRETVDGGVTLSRYEAGSLS